MERKGWIQSTFVSKCYWSRLLLVFESDNNELLLEISFYILINKILVLRVGLIIASRMLFRKEGKTWKWVLLYSPMVRNFKLALVSFTQRGFKDIFFIRFSLKWPLCVFLGYSYIVTSTPQFDCFWKNFSFPLLLFLLMLTAVRYAFVKST